MPFRGIVPWEAISQVIQPRRCTEYVRSQSNSGTGLYACVDEHVLAVPGPYPTVVYCAALPTPYSVGHSTAKCTGCGSGDRLVGYQGVGFFFFFLSFCLSHSLVSPSSPSFLLLLLLLCQGREGQGLGTQP